MKINWKVRFKNKIFLAALWSILISIAQQVAAIWGYDITIISERITGIFETILMALGLIGIIQDPTNDGLSDSERALQYSTPQDAYKNDDEEAVG